VFFWKMGLGYGTEEGLKYLPQSSVCVCPTCGHFWANSCSLPLSRPLLTVALCVFSAP
jgi:hypothetical protein